MISKWLKSEKGVKYSVRYKKYIKKLQILS